MILVDFARALPIDHYSIWDSDLNLFIDASFLGSDAIRGFTARLTIWCVFRSDGNSRFECSTKLLTLESESTGSHAPVVGGSGQSQRVMESLGYAQ